MRLITFYNIANFQEIINFKYYHFIFAIIIIMVYYFIIIIRYYHYLTILFVKIFN